MIQVVYKSVITCRQCGHTKEETIPEDACKFFYQCEQYDAMLRPKPGDSAYFVHLAL